MNTVQCGLCPKNCIIESGQSGECRIRINVDGKLLAVSYGYPCSVQIDPVEKKPLFHFLPGTSILSIATVGCNLHCQNCQNWQISQANPEETRAYVFPPEKIPQVAAQRRCRSIAYTYSEPLVFYEYTLDSCRLARQAGLRNVLVTAGYINREPMRELCRYVDAANIDLKAYSDEFYRKICSGTLKPVLETLVLTKSLGVLVEVTNLIIPTLNDSDKMLRDLCRWVAANLGRETPLHFSAFHPDFKMHNLPPTPLTTLERARQIARAEGLYHVYIGNVMSRDGETTSCHGCGEKLIERRRYTILRNVLQDGRCPKCKTEVYGVWK